jgi:type IV pilus assembly protein PilB
MMAASGTDEIVAILARKTGQDEQVLSDLLQEARGKEIRWFSTLVERELASEVDCYSAWADSLGLSFYRLDERKLDPSVLHRIPLDVAKRHRAVAVGEEDGILTVVLEDPFDLLTVDAIQEVVNSSVQVGISTPTAIDRALRRQERGTTGIEGLIASFRGSEGDQELLADAEKLQEVAGDNAVVQLVDYITEDALRSGASDIHLEPQRESFRVRLRVDGDLELLHSFPLFLHRPVISRLKVLANMDIGESRKPQDGRFMLNEDAEGGVELRVSTLPSIFGEKMVMRVLDKKSVCLELEKLGLARHNLDLFRNGFKRPNGLVLVTGPTGSGKTTTLYAALRELNAESRNLVTVEDPVEYDLPGTTQVQVDTKADRTFANALRSILRQDPDVVMVGEIRDAETAAIAIQAALTGHMVLSTLHTNDAPGAIFRLIDMGVEPYLLGPALRAVLAQRLLPTLCERCSTAADPTPEILQACGFDRDDPPDGLRDAEGCSACREKGRSGRLAIHEVLPVDETLSRLISASAPEAELMDAARLAGYERLMEDGRSKACQGKVALEDLLAVARAE